MAAAAGGAPSASKATPVKRASPVKKDGEFEIGLMGRKSADEDRC